MSPQILLRADPDRSIALATASHVLIFRHSPVLNNPAPSSIYSSPRYIVEFGTVENTDLASFTPLRKIYGTLGLITVNADVFLCVITGSSTVATVRPTEHVHRIVSVEFC